MLGDKQRSIMNQERQLREQEAQLEAARKKHLAEVDKHNMFSK
jgi:hypothetical protein